MNGNAITITMLVGPTVGVIVDTNPRPFGGGVRPAPVQGWSRRY